MTLSAKQKAFINEYLSDFNATRAAQRAGYGGDDNTLAVTGSRLLRIDKVAEAIAARMQEKAMGPDEVLRRLAEQARAEYSAYLTADGVNLQRMVDEGKAHLIKGIKDTQYGRVVEFHDAQAALVHIGKHHKLFTDKVEMEHTGSVEITADDRAQAAKELEEWQQKAKSAGGPSSG